MGTGRVRGTGSGHGDRERGTRDKEGTGRGTGDGHGDRQGDRGQMWGCEEGMGIWGQGTDMGTEDRNKGQAWGQGVDMGT